jgi:hypothetical protein
MKASYFVPYTLLGVAATGCLATVLFSSATPEVDAWPSTSYRAAVLADHPVGYWRLGEHKGPTAHDESGHKHDGHYSGKITYGIPGAIVHDPNRAIKLEGHGYVEIPARKGFSQPDSGKGLSVEVWLKPGALDFQGGQNGQDYVHWLGKGDTKTKQQEWAFRFYPSKDPSRPNRISAYIFNPDGGKGAGAYFQEPLDTKTWMHIVATFDPGDASTPGKHGVSIYKNGVLKQGPHTYSGPTSKNPTIYNGEFQITPKRGKSPVRLGTHDLQSHLIGSLDEVAIYPYVLSPEQIRHHWTLGKK